MITTSPAFIRTSSPASPPPTAITRRSVWFRSTKRPPNAPSPPPTMICAITSTCQARSNPLTCYRSLSTPYNLDDPSDVNTDPRYGIEVYFNGVLVQPQILIRPAQLGTDYTTPPFSLASVNAQVGPGFDNIVSLRGINYNAEGGGNWMGIDYVQLNAGATAGAPPKLARLRRSATAS